MMDFNTSFGQLPSDILIFLPNVASISFSVWSLQDDITEGIECLYFTLEPVDEFVDVPYGNETVTVCIEDDDRKYNYGTCMLSLKFYLSSSEVQMGFSVGKANISENNDTINIVVNKVGDTVLTTQVNLTRSYNTTGKFQLQFSFNITVNFYDYRNDGLQH